MANLDWIKVNINMFHNRKIMILLKEKDGDISFRVWIQLLTLAGQCNENGKLIMNDSTPLTIKNIAVIMGKTPAKVSAIMQRFVELEMLIYQDNTYYIKNWGVYQSADKLNKIKQDNRLRQQKYRDRKKSENNVIVTSRNEREQIRPDTDIKDTEYTRKEVENGSGFKNS